jgi:hypothetical protein
VSHWQHASLVKSGGVCSGGCYKTCRVSYAVVHPGSKQGLPWWYRGGELTAVNIGLQEEALDGEESEGEQRVDKHAVKRESDIGRYSWLGV